MEITDSSKKRKTSESPGRHALAQEAFATDNEIVAVVPEIKGKPPPDSLDLAIPAIARSKPVTGVVTPLCDGSTRIDEGNGKGFVQSPTDRDGHYRQTFWGQRPENNYSVDVYNAPDRSQTFRYSNGAEIVRRTDGSGYIQSAPNANGVAIEQHWGPLAEDTYNTQVTIRPTTDGGRLRTYPTGRLMYEDRIGTTGYDISGKDADGNYSERHFSPAGEENHLVSGNGDRTIMRADGSTVAYNKDKSQGSEISAEDQHGTQTERYWGAKPEDNYTLMVTTLSDGGKLTRHEDQSIEYLSADKKSGFTRTPMKPDGSYTEEHWGEKEKDKFTVQASLLPDGGRRFDYKNGSYVVEYSNGLFGYESTKADDKGGRIERHWGLDDRDFFQRRIAADGSSTQHEIPRDYSKLIEKRDVQPDFEAAVKRGLDRVPRPVIEQLLKNGTKIVLAHSMMSDDPKALETPEPSYGPNGKLSDRPGYYTHGSNTISLYEVHTHIGAKDKSLYPMESPEQTVVHEVGHAFDAAIGRFSHSRTFSEAYMHDLQRLSGEEMGRLRYYSANYTGDFDRQKHETFAEVFNALVNSKDRREILKSFPVTGKLISNRLKQPAKNLTFLIE